VERVYAFFDLEGGKGGLYRVAEWLRRRQVGEGFNSGRPPEASEAKLRMRRLSLQGTGGETLLEYLDHDEGIWRNRTVLWSEEVKRLQVRAQGQQKATRREHTALALELSGVCRHPKATMDGRLQCKVQGQRITATVYVRRGSEAEREREVDVMRRLYHELKLNDDGDAAAFLGGPNRRLLLSADDDGGWD
jgi:hypothetical protein